MGEIMEDNPAFLIMFDFARSQHCCIAVDIGTFSGMGSLRAIINGFLHKDRNDCIIHSFETNRERAEEALKRYKRSPFDMSFLKVHIGKISKDGFLPMNQALLHPNYEGIKGLLTFYLEEKTVYDAAEYVGDVLPETVDMVCMDGGEFSAPGDWETIKQKNPKLIVLDDIFVFKNYFIHQELMSNNNYTCIFYAPIRNGISVFLRNDVSYQVPSQISMINYSYIQYPLIWENN
jgi:hypothetical protein